MDFFSEIFDPQIFIDHKWFLYIIIWITTALLISFSGVLVWRLPVIFKIDWSNWTKGRTETSIIERSHCDNCHKVINPIYLIPVLGWILCKGKCNHCHNKVSKVWPLMELLGGLFAVGIFMLPLSLGTQTIIWLLFLWLFLLSWMDDKAYWIPDLFTFPLMFAGLLFSPIGTPMERIVGLVSYWSVMLFCLLLICLRRKSFEFLSWGDIILAGAAGAWLGFINISFYLFGAVGFGLLYYVFKKFDKETEYTNDNKMQLPFGPALSASLFTNLILILIFNISIT